MIKANLSCFIAMILWATGFVAAEELLDSWGTLAMLSARLIISAVFLIFWWSAMENLRIIVTAPWIRGIWIGALGWGAGGIFLLMGQKLSDPVTTAIVVAMMPIAAAIIEVLFSDRALTKRLSLGIFLAVVGGFLATGARLWDHSFGLGMVFCLGAIVAFAWATRMTTRTLETLSATGQATITLIGATFITLLIYFAAFILGFSETEIGVFDHDALFALFIFALPSCAIAQLFWIWGAGRLGVLLASFHMNAVPFYVMLIMAGLMSSEWQWTQAVGAFIVVVAVLISQFGLAPSERSAKETI